MLGVHLEGPFISTCKRGAHFEEFIRPLDKGWQSVVDVYGCLENVSIVTLAPELHQASDVISRLKTMGITVSLGMLHCGRDSFAFCKLKKGEKKPLDFLCIFLCIWSLKSVFAMMQKIYFHLYMQNIQSFQM